MFIALSVDVCFLTPDRFPSLVEGVALHFQEFESVVEGVGRLVVHLVYRSVFFDFDFLGFQHSAKLESHSRWENHRFSLIVQGIVRRSVDVVYEEFHLEKGVRRCKDLALTGKLAFRRRARNRGTKYRY